MPLVVGVSVGVGYCGSAFGAAVEGGGFVDAWPFVWGPVEGVGHGSSQVLWWLSVSMGQWQSGQVGAGGGSGLVATPMVLPGWKGGLWPSKAGVQGSPWSVGSVPATVG